MLNNVQIFKFFFHDIELAFIKVYSNILDIVSFDLLHAKLRLNPLQVSYEHFQAILK